MGDRTPDLRIKSPLLYQLSYALSNYGQLPNPVVFLEVMPFTVNGLKHLNQEGLQFRGLNREPFSPNGSITGTLNIVS